MKPSVNRIFSLFLCAFLAGMMSCDMNKIEYDSNDSENVQNESVTSAYFDDASDLSTKTLSFADDAAGGKTIVVSDNRFSCAVVTITPDAESTLLHPKGVLKIDFGSACTDGRGNTRSGIILIAYSGRRFKPQSSLTTTFDQYRINGVLLEGTHSIVNLDGSTEQGPVLAVSVSDGKLTWPDGSTATRDLAHRRVWTRSTGSTDVWSITGSAFGTNRSGKAYTLTITEKLVFQQICQLTHTKLLPSSGIEELVVGDKKASIDFGNGSCDQQVTITINSKSTTADLSKNL